MNGPRIDPLWVILGSVYFLIAAIGLAWWAVS